MFELLGFLTFLVVMAVWAILRTGPGQVVYSRKGEVPMTDEERQENLRTFFGTVTTDQQPLVVKYQGYSNVNIPAYTGESVKKFIYRPKTLDGYIGQEKAKAIIRDAIDVIRGFRPQHILINGRSGCGKTTLAKIFANELGDCEFISVTAADFNDPSKVEEIFIQIHESASTNVVLFIDEIHRLGKKVAEQVLYTVMEDFEWAGKPLRPFICVGATNLYGQLKRNLSPLVQRFQVKVQLDNYSDEEVEAILREYKKQLFPAAQIPEDSYREIAENCKQTPRTAQAFLIQHLVNTDLNRILSNAGVVYHGLTRDDIRILEVLAGTTRAIGEKTLAMAAGVDVADLVDVYEPYLIEQGYLNRTHKGRELTDKGRGVLKEVRHD